MGVNPLPVQWSRSSEASLDRLLRYIEAENPAAAKQLWRRVVEAVVRTSEYPEGAPSVPDLGRSYREILSVRPFRLVYRNEGNLIRILAVLRQEQDFDPQRFMETVEG